MKETLTRGIPPCSATVNATGNARFGIFGLFAQFNCFLVEYPTLCVMKHTETSFIRNNIKEHRMV